METWPYFNQDFNAVVFGIGMASGGYLGYRAEVGHPILICADEFSCPKYSLLEVSSIPASFISFEDISPTSLTVVIDPDNTLFLPQELVGYNVWHKKADIVDYPTEPTCMLSRLNRRITIMELYPANLKGTCPSLLLDLLKNIARLDDDYKQISQKRSGSSVIGLDLMDGVDSNERRIRRRM